MQAIYPFTSFRYNFLTVYAIVLCRLLLSTCALIILTFLLTISFNVLSQSLLPLSTLAATPTRYSQYTYLWPNDPRHQLCPLDRLCCRHHSITMPCRSRHARTRTNTTQRSTVVSHQSTCFCSVRARQCALSFDIPRPRLWLYLCSCRYQTLALDRRGTFHLSSAGLDFVDHSLDC